MKNERFEELMGLFLDGEITATQLDELTELVAADPVCLKELRGQLAMTDQLSQSEDQRRAAKAFLDGVRMRINATAEPDQFVEQVLENVSSSGPPPPPPDDSVIIEPEVAWLGSHRFWAIAASVIVLFCLSAGLYTNYKNKLYVNASKSIEDRYTLENKRIDDLSAKPEQMFLLAPKALVPGEQAAMRVIVRDSEKDLPAVGAAVEVSMVSGEGDEVWKVSTIADEDGVAQVMEELPEDLAEGQYTVKAKIAGDEQSVVEHNVKLTRSFRVMTTTDKPLYQPGQVIHIRSLSLANADMRPVAGSKTVIEVQDAKGNKVFKKVGETSGFGIFSADFRLADQVNTGSYTISAIVGDTTSERTVAVERYKLPTFKIALSVDKGFYQPGQMVSGTVSAQYTFGKSVAGGKIKITASEFIERFQPFEIIEGVLDEDGKFPFEFRLKGSFVGQERNQRDAFVSLQAEVMDKADHTQKKNHDLTVTARPIRIEVFPESGTLVQNVENTLYVLTAYPDGRPAKTQVTIGSNRQEVETSDAGIAKVKITPDKPSLRLRVAAEDKKGVRSAVVRMLRIDRRTNAFLMRTDQALYKTGDTVKLDIISPSNKERIFVDVVKDRRAILMKSIDITNGKGTMALDLPADLFGTLELRGYRIQPDGNIIGDTKVIQVKRADSLVIEAKLVDKETNKPKETYKPAETALINFIVKRADGTPAQAALGLSGVDEAVFALSEMRPGLERVYFAIQEEILKPRYQINVRPPIQAQQLIEPMPEPGLEPEPQPELDEAAVVLFAAAEGTEAPVADVGPNFEEKKQIVKRKQRESYKIARKKQRESKDVFRESLQNYKTSLTTARVLSPFAIFILMILPILGYAVFKFRQRQPSDMGGIEARQAHGATGHVLLWWVLGINLPALGGLLAYAIYDKSGNDPVVYLFFGFALFTVMTAVGLLVYAVDRARNGGALAALPFFRKVLAPLPWALLLAMGGTIAVCLVAKKYTQLLDFKVAVMAVLGVFALLALTGGALAIARESMLRKLAAGRMAWVGLSRTCLAGLPLILAGLLIQTNGGFAKVTNFAKDTTRDGRGGFKNAVMMQADGDDMAGGVLFFAEDGALDEMDMAPGMDLALPRAMKKMEMAIEETLDATGGEEGGGGGGQKKPVRIRRYFPETLLWKPAVITDEQGRAELSVPLADSITTWRLSMSAVSKAGELGSGTTGIRVFQDFFVDIDFPVALTQHDQVSVPVAVYNYLDKSQTVKLEVKEDSWFKLLDDKTKTLEIGAQEVTRVYFTLEAIKPGNHALTLKAFGSELVDAVERQVRVEPDGKRFEQVLNGRLDENLNQTIEFPVDAIDGANDLYVKIYPGAFSQVMEGLDGIFQMPYGCFEQTSSATYPNILVLDYMRRTKQIKPEIEIKALNFINLGYQRLLSYEVKGGGFEWFGKPPAHNVLTAYGLMEFSDMAKVYDVDPKVIERTRNWLYSKQKGDGSWPPDQGGIAEGAINAFQGATLRTTAYIAWALAESGQSDRQLNKALDYIIRKSDGEDDNYTLALCANAFAAAKRNEEARDFTNRLLAAKEEEKELVYWTSKGQGLTHGRGNTLAIETTALVAHAFLKSRQHAAIAHKALAWLIVKKDGRGTWHSTQATVHAMRALLVGSDTGGGGVEKDLSIALIANGKPAKQIDITPETSDVFRLISLRHLMKEGENTITLEPSDKGNLAYQIVAIHYLPWPEEQQLLEEPELTIDVKYDATTLKKDDTLGVNVKVQYHRDGTADMTIVDLGIPPGFDVLPEYFQGLKDEGMIEKYSITGRQVILYFREIKSEEPVVFSYELKAKFPVKAKTPKSTAYQYYEPEIRAEAQPVELVVK